uniref:Uncharacterized protein n=1 Tax=Anguilla anguilla TaxID=7936 RepID=A0A0E9RB52_ANGAN
MTSLSAPQPACQYRPKEVKLI